MRQRSIDGGSCSPTAGRAEQWRRSGFATGATPSNRVASGTEPWKAFDKSCSPHSKSCSSLKYSVRLEASKDERHLPGCRHHNLSDSYFDTSVRTGHFTTDPNLESSTTRRASDASWTYAAAGAPSPGAPCAGLLSAASTPMPTPRHRSATDNSTHWCCLTSTLSACSSSSMSWRSVTPTSALCWSSTVRDGTTRRPCSGRPIFDRCSYLLTRPAQPRGAPVGRVAGEVLPQPLLRQPRSR